ncbi:NAD dependent oxidoreductase [Rhodotorula toruloides]|uniref:NAD dependent oxidoreductase n=1 Tax=Rhodotorula toruloides TaxID=5286 RepID=A0A511KQC6_RHOTO|nr:NAD dependent oxidoreductase [Rhodotorula toruloides]
MLRALSASSDKEWKKIIAISRCPPVLDHKDPRVVFESVDLLAPKDELVQKLRHAGAAEASHTFFYAYIAKEDEQELIDVNRALFGNAMGAVATVAKQMKVFLLQTGYKYYGTHKGGKHLAAYPWRADSPRHEGGNFYYVQEDMLKDACSKNGWKWIVTRPNFILGITKGNLMSLATTVALYASGCKALNQALVFPGSSASYKLEYDQSTAANNAAFQIFAATTEKAYDRAFNIYDGNTETFADLWPKIANYFGVKLASPPADEPPSSANIGVDVVNLHSAAAWAKKHKSDLEKLVKEKNLDSDALKYATWDFLDFATSRTWKDRATLDEASLIGWTKSVDSFEDGFKPVFEELKRLKVIPA